MPGKQSQVLECRCCETDASNALQHSASCTVGLESRVPQGSNIMTVSPQHSPLGAVDTGQVSAVAPRRTNAGVVLEEQGILAPAALVARFCTILHQLTQKGLTTRDWAGVALNLLQGSRVGREGVGG